MKNNAPARQYAKEKMGRQFKADRSVCRGCLRKRKEEWAGNDGMRKYVCMRVMSDNKGCPFVLEHLMAEGLQDHE